MSELTDSFDLSTLGLLSGDGRRLTLAVAIEPLELGDQQYTVEPPSIPVTLDVSRMTGNGYALRLRFQAALTGPCMRCLEAGSVPVCVDAREVDEPGGGEELESPYFLGESLQLAAWARDAFALELPAQVHCREDCAGLCAVCAANLNEAGPEHHHEAPPDPRWAKLRELQLE